ncbi:hypothetical protein A0H81_01639 [Grifola frondosa]|uniref:Uncharacterized protein n=1 Tax=Grifola frondosa TaxID=5627 RepID=A0A1C7MSK7_GRIFR|nr:hypothetical protein A0H81_01639 [Grifola frondosa]
MDAVVRNTNSSNYGDPNPACREGDRLTPTSAEAFIVRLYPQAAELHQDMAESMADAIVQCMTTTSLNRNAQTPWRVLSSYYGIATVLIVTSFDMIVRRVLDPVWHKVGLRTKQLVSNLATLRRLLSYLLTYDALAFHAYLKTLIASNTYTDSGAARQHQSSLLLTHASNINRLAFLGAMTQVQIVLKPT